MINGINSNRPITLHSIPNLSTITSSRHLEHSSLESMKKKKSCFSWIQNYFLSIASSLMNILSSLIALTRATVCFPSKALHSKITNVESQVGHPPKISASEIDPKSSFGSLVFEKNANGKYQTDSNNHLIFKRKKGIALNENLYQFLADNNLIEWYRHEYTTLKDIEDKLTEMKMHPLEYLYYTVMTEKFRENLNAFLNKYNYWPVRGKVHSRFISKQIANFNQFDHEKTLSYIPDYCKLLKLNTESFLKLAKERKWEEFIYLTIEKTK